MDIFGPPFNQICLYDAASADLRGHIISEVTLVLVLVRERE